MRVETAESFGEGKEGEKRGRASLAQSGGEKESS